MIWRRILGVGGMIAALLVAGCSPLKTFDFLVPKDADGERLAEAVPFAPGPRRRLDIYAPKGSGAADSLPVVVFFYGGSWASGTREGYAFVGRALAAQGFVTVIPDYRLVPDVTYPSFVEDGASAVRWVIGHIADYGGDPQRIVLAGHSAGAYIAAMLAVDRRWLGADRSHVKGLVGLAGPYDFAPFDVPETQAAFGAWPKPEDTQPVHWASAGDPPALLMYGEKDETVLPRNTLALAKALRGKNVPVTVNSFPSVGHVGLVNAIALPFRDRASVLVETAQFVRKVTAGDQAP